MREAGASPAALASRFPSAFPLQCLEHLDALWLQVAGTDCNLRCRHCFVSCGPGDVRHGMLSRAEVAARVSEALPLGVREFYFTGGEPFLHPGLLAILGDTLTHGPCTVLTNGTLMTRSRVAALADLARGARYSLEIRVSLDGLTAAAHDALRGPGAFLRALDGLRALDAGGLLPIATLTYRDDEDPAAFALGARRMLLAEGVRRPRLKLIPMFRLGREAERGGGYSREQTLAGWAAAPDRLQCASVRAVTSRGVFVCPLLVDEPGARMGARLDEALGPFALAHGACFTCAVTGMTCGNG